jgi:hypothetical protein
VQKLSSKTVETDGSADSIPNGKNSDNSHKIHRFMQRWSGTKLKSLTLVIVLATAAVLYVRALAPERFGTYGDDAIYVTTAKALATGQGYRILSLPYEPMQTLYPPLYPFLLSLIWRAYPQFPENLPAMMLLSIIATLGFLALTNRYLVRHAYATAGQALIVICLAAFNWRTIYWATILLSDMLFAAISVAGLYLAEKYEGGKRTDLAQGIVLGIIMGLAFLARSSAVTLIAAVAVYYMFRRRWQRVLLPLAIVGVFVVGWTVWCAFNRSSFSGANSEYYAGYVRCFSEGVNYLQALNGTSTFITLAGMIGTNFALLAVASVPLASVGLGYGLPEIVFISLALLAIALIATGFLRQAGKRFRLLHVYLILYIALHMLLPGCAYDRYLTPVVPFLLVFLVTELDVVISKLRDSMKPSSKVFAKIAAVSVGSALVFAICLTVFSNGAAVYKLLASTPLNKTARPAPEFAPAIDWINAHTKQSDLLLCNSDPTYYLYTGRKATASYSLIMLTTVPYQARYPSFDQQASDFLKIVEENDRGYLILNSSDFKYESSVPGESIKELVEQSPKMFTAVFTTPDGRSAIYRINSPN